MRDNDECLLQWRTRSGFRDRVASTGVTSAMDGIVTRLRSVSLIIEHLHVVLVARARF